MVIPAFELFDWLGLVIESFYSTLPLLYNNEAKLHYIFLFLFSKVLLLAKIELDQEAGTEKLEERNATTTKKKKGVRNP